MVANVARLDKSRSGKIAMHRITTTALTAACICVLASCTSKPPPAATAANLGPTEGTVSFSGGAIAIGVGFQWGNGTLT